MLTTRSRNMIADMDGKIKKQLDVKNYKHMFQRVDGIIKKQDPKTGCTDIRWMKEEKEARKSGLLYVKRVNTHRHVNSEGLLSITCIVLQGRW